MSGAFDIAVVGSGAAGIAAAVCAARAGCKTMLIDSRPGPGGTGGFSGLTTLCGLHGEEGDFLNAGFSGEFAEALAREDGVRGRLKMGRVYVQLYRPASFQKLASRFLEAEALLSTRWGTPLRDVRISDSRITSLNGEKVAAVVDCTGIAEVGSACGEALMSTDETTQAPSVILSLRNVERDLQEPLSMAPVILALARAGMPLISFTPSLEPGSVSMKFAGQPSEVPALLNFLQKEVSGFERCETTQTEFTAAQRAGKMIVGKHVLTGIEVLGAQKFPDAVARACWPVEQWSKDGRPHVRYLQSASFYEIPARALRAARTENLFMAGKSLSADVEAVASARVMGICLATGAAAGQLAADFVRSSGLPSEASAKEGAR